MLGKKMVRDIFKHKSQFISIFLMAFLGVFVFAGVGGESVGLEVNVNDFYLKNARIPQLLQVVDELHYWVYYLFLINFILFIFILCFLEAILGLGFLFSILFCCDYIIAWGMKNCFGFEKLL
jgi:hypothetical protein